MDRFEVLRYKESQLEDFDNILTIGRFIRVLYAIADEETDREFKELLEEYLEA